MPDQHDHHLDEGSWIYLGLGTGRRGVERDLRPGLVEACEGSGWPAVSWAPPSSADPEPGDERLLDGMGHAVEHADAVVVLVGDASEWAGRELDCALGSGRPVIGLCLGESASPEVRARIQGSESARLLECADVHDCAEELRGVLTDPEFAAAIRDSTAEPLSRV